MHGNACKSGRIRGDVVIRGSFVFLNIYGDVGLARPSTLQCEQQFCMSRLCEIKSPILHSVCGIVKYQRSSLYLGVSYSRLPS